MVLPFYSRFDVPERQENMSAVYWNRYDNSMINYKDLVWFTEKLG